MPGKKWSLERLRAESGTWRSAILIAAVQLDLFAWIGKREKSRAALAAHFGGNPEGWEIFLNALCAMGLLRKRREKYANSRFSSKHLSSDEAAFLLPEYDAWQAWGGLASVLRSGARPDTQKPFFSDTKKAHRLLRALEVDGRAIAPHLIAKLPVNRAGTLLDLGGGLGAFSIALCRRYPRLRATVVEHPRVASLARRAVRKAGLAKRMRVVGMDFSRQALPRGFDTVFVSNVLHSYGVEENRSLLAKIRNGLKPDGQVIVRDVFMSGDRAAPEWAALFSVCLLLHTPRGRCYTLDEIVGWLRQAGFSRIKGPFRSSPLSFDPDSFLIAKT
jgi:3-hydroxy-5-methyl-1-naphthoate 3-O-methyltransferase